MTDIIHTAAAVPPGYHHTNAGVLPNEWTSRPLGSIVEEITETAGTRKIETVSISAGVGFVNQAEKFGKELSGKQYEKYTVLHRGDFSYNKGNSNLYPQGCIYRLNDRTEAAVPNVFESFRVSDGNPDFYEQLFISGFLNRQLYSRINRGVRDDGLLNLRGKDFYSCEVPCPPPAEQEHIAEILMQCDKVIELKQRIIKELGHLKKACLRMMFPEKGRNKPVIRFPGFSEAWEQRKFDEVCDCTVPNNTLSRAELSYDEGTVLNVHYGDVLIKYGSVLDVQKDDIPRIPHRCREDFNGALLLDGDVIIADTAEDETTGKACEIGNLQGSAIVSGLHTMVCRPRNRMALGYLGYYLNSNAYHHQLLPLMQGIKVLSLSRSNIQKTSVSYPIAVKEQQLIAYYFSQLDHLITLHQRELEESKKKKKVLAQLLLTGVIRVRI